LQRTALSAAAELIVRVLFGAEQYENVECTLLDLPMLIYAAADIHGHPYRMRSIEKQVAAHQPDVVVLAGDISGRCELDGMLEALKRLALPVLMIYGNCDRRDLKGRLSAFPNLHFIHRTSMRVGDVEIVGIGGTLPLPFHSRLGFREREAVAHVKGMLQKSSVLVAHPPPYGVRDRVLGLFHSGSRAVRKLMDSCSPALVICGHIHEQAGISKVDGTAVVNCAMGRSGNGALIRYDGSSDPICRMLTPIE
jgi:Icc-related predicted phosphoesterase